ncbi:hypothetical protein L218DRAFT_999806 [Marasmius fiardii PR-910]|nr:hypothetical protein L218DRAFT_999806 [Marasmius fiardii PR-910]
MASDTVKNVQDKLFGKTSSSDRPIDGLPSTDRGESPLKIDIPKPPTVPSLPKAQKLDQTQAEDGSAQGLLPWRARLASKLGPDYKGAERWGEDGIMGISDNHQRLCFSVGLWNGEDPILKERLFGVTGHQGNHGEDVKELYYYLDSTPTHSYMKGLYKYPQRRYPYEQLISENQNRSREVSEFEVLDTDAFEDDRYWDVFVEYAKDEDDPDNLYIRITSYNRGPDPATLHIIPQLWFPNTWSWSLEKPEMPSLTAHNRHGVNYVSVKHPSLGRTHLYCLPSPPPVGPSGNFEVDGDEAVDPELLFTENNTNFSRLYGGQNDTLYVKDAFHDHIIPSHRPPASDSEEDLFSKRIRSRTYSTYGSEPSDGLEEGPCTPFPIGPSFVNPDRVGTKFGAHYVFRDVPGQGGCAVVRLKLTPLSIKKDSSVEDEAIFDDAVEERRQEADEFYASLVLGPMSDDFKQIMRQALGGMLWMKQFCQFIQQEWLSGDPAQPPPPPERRHIGNRVGYACFLPPT